MLVRDIMVKNPITVRVDTTIIEAERIMRVNRIGRLIVLDDRDNVVGVLTNGDLMQEHSSDILVDELMSREVIKAYDDISIQEAARMLNDNQIGGMPVFNRKEELVGIITAQDIVGGYIRETEPQGMTPERAAIYLVMTLNREDEAYWLEKVKEFGYRGAITQTGANAEKLAIKMRESITVAAIARGVITENSKEKIAISNAVKDAFIQLQLTNPGLGGGFKIAVVRGEGRVVVAIFGKFGHALVDGPEQLAMGSSII